MRKFLWALLISAVACAFYTQLAHLTSVPGLHFDEAWQGNFAFKLASVSDFHPLSAMNSYTSPVVHYILAAAFKIFGPGLEVMRGTYAAMNFLSLFLISLLLWLTGERLAVAWFVLFWALLPLSVHDHRFYVEMTGFFSLCLALLLWGVALWNRLPKLSFLIIVASIVAGVYSHILFVSAFLSGALVLARAYPREFRSRRAQILVCVLALCLMPLALRMGLGLKKVLPFVLASGLAGVALGAYFIPNIPLFYNFWMEMPKRVSRIRRYILFASLPVMIPFICLHWNGFWPYAQATGDLRLWWLPINAVLFFALAGYQLGWISIRHDLTEPTIRMPRDKYLLLPVTVWGAFVTTFAFNSLLILKQSPRYYMVPAILGMMWMAQRTARIRSVKKQAVLALIFIGWNLWAFQSAYISQFERKGSTTNEFKLGFFHDNGRDFRPFQKVFAWAIAQNCQQALKWVEDDRFGHPIEFLRRTAPPVAGQCPWSENNLFLSHIPNYDPNFKGERNEINTPPPVENVKFLAHFDDWGDLAVWIRR